MDTGWHPTRAPGRGSGRCTPGYAGGGCPGIAIRGTRCMNNRFAFLEMAAANDLLEDPTALREQFDRDGYLYFDGSWTPRSSTRSVGTSSGCWANCWTETRTIPLRRAVACPCPTGRWTRSSWPVTRRCRSWSRSTPSRTHPTLLATMRANNGDTAFPHLLKIARLNFPDSYETSTPPHQDYPNNSGHAVAHCGLGPPCERHDRRPWGLAVLRGSHKWGRLPVAGHMGAGNRCAVVPPDMAEACRTGDHRLRHGRRPPLPRLHGPCRAPQRAGVLHAALDRLPVPVGGRGPTPGCLEPHFQRLTWEEIYECWESTDLQYYWKTLDYEVVPVRADRHRRREGHHRGTWGGPTSPTSSAT